MLRLESELKTCYRYTARIGSQTENNRVTIDDTYDSYPIKCNVMTRNVLYRSIFGTNQLVKEDEYE